MIKKCPDCTGELEEGAVMDTTYGGVLVERYAKTQVPKGKQKFALMTEADFRDIRRVVTYRCIQCNRLFSYAQETILGDNLWSGAGKRFLYVLIMVAAIVGIVFIIVASTSRF